jgi:CheY-like chemotaxis protein
MARSLLYVGLQRPTEGAVQILVIDDSTTTRGLLRRALQQSFPDCVVREAVDGKSAIHELTQGRVDLITTDLEMPGIDGHRLLETLRGNPLLRRKKILVFSSAISAAIRAKFADDPLVAFLNKPASNEAIARSIQELQNVAIA